MSSCFSVPSLTTGVGGVCHHSREKRNQMMSGKYFLQTVLVFWNDFTSPRRRRMFARLSARRESVQQHDDNTVRTSNEHTSIGLILTGSKVPSRWCLFSPATSDHTLIPVCLRTFEIALVAGKIGVPYRLQQQPSQWQQRGLQPQSGT